MAHPSREAVTSRRRIRCRAWWSCRATNASERAAGDGRTGLELDMAILSRAHGMWCSRNYTASSLAALALLSGVGLFLLRRFALFGSRSVVYQATRPRRRAYIRKTAAQRPPPRNAARKS